MLLKNRLINDLLKRKSEGNLRSLSVPESFCKSPLFQKTGVPIDFFSNDYLGFAKENIGSFFPKDFHTDLYKIRNGGSTGSRLLSGNSEFIQAAEKFVANYHNCEAALLFHSGYDANLGLLSCLPSRHDWVFYDASVHSSIRDGIRLWGGSAFSFLHNDLKDLDYKYKSVKERFSENYCDSISKILVIESIYSMDGDMSPIELFSEWCDHNDFTLIVDEAHSAGIFGSLDSENFYPGNGIISQKKLDNSVFAKIITYGKAFGSCGAAILGDQILIDYLVNFCRPFIYTTAPSDSFVQAILNSYKLIEDNSADETLKLFKNMEYFKMRYYNEVTNSNFKLTGGDAGIVCIETGSIALCISVANTLRKINIYTKPILSPTVPKGKEKLRFCMHSYNTFEEIEQLIDVLKNAPHQ